MECNRELPQLFNGLCMDVLSVLDDAILCLSQSPINENVINAMLLLLELREKMEDC